MQNVFERERRAQIESHIESFKLDSAILQQVDCGSFEVALSRLKALLKVYPRENELRQLVGCLNELGLSSFNEALSSIERGDLACESVEHFIIRFLSYPSDLKLKADVLVKIQEASPRMNELAGRIQCW